MYPNRSVDILLVDDNHGDIRLAREALRDDNIVANLHVAMDGVEALSFLRREGAYADVPRPDLILLDLKLPRKDGFAVLLEAKSDAALRRIPIVILSSSDAPDDIGRAYDLQASCYVTKPTDLDEYLRVGRLLREFCLTVVKLPPRG